MHNDIDSFKLSSDFNNGVKEIEKRSIINNNKIAQSQLITYRIPPLYAQYIGSTVTIGFNGSFMKLPVDGSAFQLSRGHYNQLIKYLKHVDKQVKIAQQNAKFMDMNVNGDFRKM